MYKARGYTIVLSTWYERGTTEFQPIATKLAQTQADVMDLSGAAGRCRLGLQGTRGAGLEGHQDLVLRHRQ